MVEFTTMNVGLLVLFFFLTVGLAYVLGLVIVKIVDKRLSQIHVNIPRPSVTVNVDSPKPSQDSQTLINQATVNQVPTQKPIISLEKQQALEVKERFDNHIPDFVREHTEDISNITLEHKGNEVIGTQSQKENEHFEQESRIIKPDDTLHGHIVQLPHPRYSSTLEPPTAYQVGNKIMKINEGFEGYNSTQYPSGAELGNHVTV